MLDEKKQLYFSGGRIHPYRKTPENCRWLWRETPEIKWGNWRFSAVKVDQLPENLPLTSACFDWEEIPEILEIGEALPGEKMLPFGRSNMAKIKELRIKRQIPAYPVNPVLRIPGDRVLWLPGIRHSGESLMRPGRPGVMISGEKIKDFN